jgi:hypothetical protein
MPSPPRSPEEPANPGPSLAHLRRRRSNRRKLKKQLEEVKGDLAKERKLAMKYKKRWQRLQKAATPETPRGKTKKLLKLVGTKQFKKKLLMHVVVSSEIKEKYKSEKTQMQKRRVRMMVANSMSRKYRVRRAIQKEFGFSKNDPNGQRKPYNSKSTKLQRCISNFYLRDDNSSATAGVNQTKTAKSVKMQKRLLLDSLKRLHEKFQAENPSAEVSYTLFCRHRPFWVLPPKESDRETCLCKIHENTQFVVSKLHCLKAIDSSDPSDLMKKLTCCTKSQACMHGKCPDCKEIFIPVNSATAPEANDAEGFRVFPLNDVDRNSMTTWYKWTTKREERTIKGNHIIFYWSLFLFLLSFF